jgi:hypothetical protein
VRGLRAEVEFLRAQRDSRQRVFAVHPEQGAEAVAPTRRSAGLAGQSQASDLAEPKAASQRQDAGQTAPRQSTALIIWHD